VGSGLGRLVTVDDADLFLPSSHTHTHIHKTHYTRSHNTRPSRPAAADPRLVPLAPASRARRAEGGGGAAPERAAAPPPGGLHADFGPSGVVVVVAVVVMVDGVGLVRLTRGLTHRFLFHLNRCVTCLSPTAGLLPLGRRGHAARPRRAALQGTCGSGLMVKGGGGGSSTEERAGWWVEVHW
jgi:hypothetical protein